MSTAGKISILAGFAAGLTVLGVRMVFRRKVSAEEMERRRRAMLHASGRLGDATITEADGATIFYSYSVHGVQYEASQDVSTLSDRLPGDPERLIGPVGIKYAPKNPANSIVVCEEWSGLRGRLLHGDAVRHQPQDSALAERSQG